MTRQKVKISNLVEVPGNKKRGYKWKIVGITSLVISTLDRGQYLKNYSRNTMEFKIRAGVCIIIRTHEKGSKLFPILGEAMS